MYISLTCLGYFSPFPFFSCFYSRHSGGMLMGAEGDGIKFTLLPYLCLKRKDGVTLTSFARPRGDGGAGIR